jgi:hypothetical protein
VLILLSFASYCLPACLPASQLSNHLVVAFGAGGHGLGGCARVEVFAFCLLDDADLSSDLRAPGASASRDGGAAAGLRGTGRGKGGGRFAAAQLSRFAGLAVGGGGLARRGELKTLAFLDTPRVSFVTALQARTRGALEETGPL